MHALGDALLLSLWDRGRGKDQVARAVLLAGAACGPGDRDPAALSIGERDAAIVRLRVATFGPRLQGCARCSGCGEWMAFDFDCACVIDDCARPAIAEFEVAGLRFRLPDSRDLAAVGQARDAADAGRCVLVRCCLDSVDARAWPETFVREAEARIAQCDPVADIRLDLHCAGCGTQWKERLDIAAFFWDEIDLRARRLLDEVHCLACAYGWSEARILALGERRRRDYIERCSA